MTPVLDITSVMEEFCNRVSDLKEDHETMFKFLKHTGYDLKKAENMIRKTAKWRKENKVQSCLQWSAPLPVVEDFRFEFVGEDKDGYPVLYNPIGDWHMKKIMEMGYRDECFKFRLYILEKILDTVKKSKRDKFVAIMDMHGLTYKKCIHYDTIHMLMTTFKEFEENYPGRLRTCYVINAPWTFTYMYNILKHAFSSKTLEKARIFGDKTQWKPTLMEKIPEKVVNGINYCNLSDVD